MKWVTGFFFSPLLKHPSPWVRYITQALLGPYKDPNEAALKSALRRYSQSTSSILVDGIPMPTSDYIPRSVMPPSRSRLIAKVVHAMREPLCLELGTNAGFTSARMAAACNGGRLITIDLQAHLQEMAKQLHTSLGLNNITYVTGTFSEELSSILSQNKPIGCALIDGDHEEQTTLDYVELLKPGMASESVMFIDDIHHSAQMKRCWQQITQMPWIAATIEFRNLGVCIIDSKYTGRPLSLALPSFMHRML